MYSLLLASLLFAADPSWNMPYKKAQDEAIRRNVPVVVAIGMEPLRVESEDWVGTRADWLTECGYKDKTVAVFKPSNGTLYLDCTFNEGEPVRITPVVVPPPFPDALHEVNQLRSQRGLRPYLPDPGLTEGAWKCASFRAMNRMEGHTNNDFSFSSAPCSATGCAAWHPSMGWGSCCIYDNYTYAGASYAIGADGRRYMSLFCR